MNILSYFKNLFTTTPVEQKPNSKNIRSDENSITFAIDGFGRSWVSMELVNTDEKSCEMFAKTLLDINNGGYEQTILDLIVKLSKEKPSLALPLETILISWGLMLTTEKEPLEKVAKNTGNKPFIRPRNVFLGANK